MVGWRTPITVENDYRPRKSINVTEEQLEKLRELIPYGLHNAVFSAIIDDLIEALEYVGPELIALIIRRQVNLSDYSRTIKKAHDEASRPKTIDPTDGA